VIRSVQCVADLEGVGAMSFSSSQVIGIATGAPAVCIFVGFETLTRPTALEPHRPPDR
jgi:hypothetical protein